jgi:hypothetical protein
MVAISGRQFYSGGHRAALTHICRMAPPCGRNTGRRRPLCPSGGQSLRLGRATPSEQMSCRVAANPCSGAKSAALPAPNPGLPMARICQCISRSAWPWQRSPRWHATRQSVLLYEGDFPVLEILVGKSGKQPQRRGSPLSQAISVRSSISTSRHVVLLFPQSRGSPRRSSWLQPARRCDEITRWRLRVPGRTAHGRVLSRERNFKFFPAMICRLDYTDETHSNSISGFLLRAVPHVVTRPHYHSSPLNRRFFRGITAPQTLHDAVPYNEPGRTFDAILRWFCADTNIESLPPGHLISLPAPDFLV